MFAEITSANIASDGTTTVTFSMANDQNYPYIGLASNRIRFTFAYLVPPDPITGEPSKWMSYINRVESAPSDPAKGPGTEDQLQATSESNGTLTDNLDGTYTYTFNVNPTSVTSPAAITYNADLTHRVAFQISGGDYPTLNRTYDWQPSTGLTDGITSREMVVEGTCNACHGNLAIHGGGRVDTAYCVTCHNPGSTDANSGNTVDMAPMIHKIHMGANLPSVVDGGEYAIWGYRDSKHDYSDVHLPQDVRNCRSCHDETISETPDAGNWKNVPTIESCGSCHDDVDFETGAGHIAGPFVDNSECATCHMEGRLVSTLDTHVGVMEAKQSVASNVTAAVEDVRIDLGTGDVEVDVRLQIDGVNVTALRDGAGDDTDQGAFLGAYRNLDNGALAINWDDGTGFQFTHFEIAFNDCAPDGSGLFTCNEPGLLAGITASDVVTITTVDFLICMNEKDGMIARCDSPESMDTRVAQVPVTPVAYSYLGDGTETMNGYDKISASAVACESCHADQKYHHASTELLQCKTCHNATRQSYRAGQPGDLKHNVHRLHATLAAVNPLTAPDGDSYDVFFPGNISTCTACHTESQVEIPVAVNARPSVANAGSRGAPDARYTSPTAVVCASCHLDVASGYVNPALGGLIDPANGSISLETQAVIDHMIQNGAVFGATTFEEANKVESCSVCHAKGKESGIDKVHNFK
jgi:OmcA/MtrC family decaheme c-type cytochrome